MLYLILLFIELSVLYFFSKRMTAKIFKVFYRMTGNRDWAIYLLAVLFLPGTFIHEISHFLAALFLLVPVGELEIMPQVQNEGVKLGSVSIGRSDPIRRFLIGVAPFILGTTIIIGGFYYLVANSLFERPYFAILTVYFLFAIANTMFASKKDLEGAAKLFVFILLIYSLVLITGVRFPFLEINAFANPNVLETLRLSVFLLLVPLGIDLIFISVFKVFKV